MSPDLKQMVLYQALIKDKRLLTAADSLKLHIAPNSLKDSDTFLGDNPTLCKLKGVFSYVCGRDNDELKELDYKLFSLGKITFCGICTKVFWAKKKRR